MTNDVYPMRQFWVVETARAKYLMTWSKEFSFMWGFTRVLRELPR